MADVVSITGEPLDPFALAGRAKPDASILWAYRSWRDLKDGFAARTKHLAEEDYDRAVEAFDRQSRQCEEAMTATVGESPAEIAAQFRFLLDLMDEFDWGEFEDRLAATILAGIGMLGERPQG